MTGKRAGDHRAPDAAPRGAAAQHELAGPPPVASLPAVVPPAPQPRPHRPFRRAWLLLLLLPAIAGAGYWWRHSGPVLPPGIAVGNGRLEADEIDIDTKFAGRIARMFVDEGDLVRQGQVVAMMDTRDLAATLKKDEALVDQAERALDEAKANFAQQQTAVTFAEQEYDRTSALVPRGFATVEQLDRRRQQLMAANDGLDAAEQKVREHGGALAAESKPQVARFRFKLTLQASRYYGVCRPSVPGRAIDANQGRLSVSAVSSHDLAYRHKEGRDEGSRLSNVGEESARRAADAADRRAHRCRRQNNLHQRCEYAGVEGRHCTLTGEGRRVTTARDIMTTDVFSVSPETTTREVARLLLDHGISAVPVVDHKGAPVGMISEGDLVGRNAADREARRDWWLTLLAEGEAMNPEFLNYLQKVRRAAREIMSAPVVTVEESAEVSEIARLLATHRIKRVPVVRDGRVVGIVSRADLLRALAANGSAPSPAAVHETGLFARSNHGFHHHRLEPAGHPAAPLAPAAAVQPLAADFRALGADFKRGETQHREAERRAAAERRRALVEELINHHIGDDSWRAMLHNARQAAEAGRKEAMLLRFPSALCSDGGRAINSLEHDWPNTLRGEAAELCRRWERELKPNGFHLVARVLDFPGGMPGDIGLFLLWGE
jgi:CBS domain-containing protein/biotin carboxyl carrier protein